MSGAPEKSGNITPALTVLTVACSNIGNKTLPWVRLKTHVNTKVAPNTDKTKGAMIGIANSFPMSGKCQTAHQAPRIRLAISGEYLLCNCGRAKPRQPGSSPRPMNNRMKRNRSGSSRILSIDRTEAGGAKQRVIATAIKQRSTGVPKVTAYHLKPTRQRTKRLKSHVGRIDHRQLR